MPRIPNIGHLTAPLANGAHQAGTEAAWPADAAIGPRSARRGWRAKAWAALLRFGLAFLPSAAMAIIPTSGGTVGGSPVTIHAGTGDQNDPHVSGDWMAYTSDLTIRYYNFVTNVDAQIPLGASSRDLLSDISGSKIVFCRVITGIKTAVMVFDAATPAVPPVEINPSTGTTRIGSAIGGNTIAYVDFSLEAHGELVIYDLLTASSRRATIDVALDANPSVSPDGNVVTWEKCLTSFSNCDIWQAVRTGTTWNVSVLADSVDHEANPDSNGNLGVYDSLRNANLDVFWRSITAGSEFQLQMSSFEQNPSMAGNFVAVESRATLFDTTDIFVYDITTNLLYQITNTPSFTEQLNDITVLPDGRIRVVWSEHEEDGFDQRNIKSATFSLAPPDVTPPVITPPATITANATMPAGAIVNFAVQASDNVGVVSLICVPPSGGVFPIGVTEVQCTARDAAGNTSTSGFRVRIKGAPEQILDLAIKVGTTPMPLILKVRLLTALAVAYANRSNPVEACAALSAFIQMVQVQPPSVIPAAVKAQMISDATRIKAVFGCT